MNSKYYSSLISVFFGVIYGLVMQFFAKKTESWESIYLVMSLGYIFILPVCIGAVTVYYSDEEQKKSWIFRIFMPWLTTSICLLAAFFIGWEGSICLIMALPVFLTMASVGGIITGIILSVMNKNKFQELGFLALLSLPMIIGFSESYYELNSEVRQVNTSIVINSNSENVWKNIVRIPAITELQTGFFYKMGFPKPVEANLSFDGIGGIRIAKFERGLFFIETITKWEENKKITFTIQADPNATPITTLDSHVVPGGRYFDALLGEYEIIKLNDNSVRLLLLSKYRLSTNFNIYASLWGDYLMRDIQENILNVIKYRTEKL